MPVRKSEGRSISEYIIIKLQNIKNKKKILQRKKLPRDPKGVRVKLP
jgi:hypothetical protein